MKVVQLESIPALDNLVKALERGDASEPIALERHGPRVAMIISSEEYAHLAALEEALTDKLDRDESSAILKDPRWIDWDKLQRQLKP